MMGAGAEDLKIFEIDGVDVKVFIAVSLDSRHVQYVLEGAKPLDNLVVAKVLEVLGSNLIRGMTIPPAIYAKELN